ncbi:MAG: SDR family oxidoreductase [Kofleriaceae bacterium]|nr:SDR family oxidoreductase [Kofleriaceae bacterium]
MSLIALVKGRRGASGFGHASTAEEVTQGIDLSGKTVVITGANSGLGAETARVLAMRGADVIALARNPDKAAKAAELLPRAVGVACELSEPDSVRQCVKEILAMDRKIDILICNAGIMALPKLEQKDGYELQFYTNHVGHFLLITGLMDALSEDARVVMLSSYGHTLAKRGIELDNLSGTDSYSSWRAYGRSKLANLLMAVELSSRFEGSQRTANAVHPGVIRTNLGRHLHPVMNGIYAATGAIYAKSPEQGAATTCYVATNSALSEISGKYFSDSNLCKTSRHGRDKKMAKELWEASEKIATESV